MTDIFPDNGQYQYQMVFMSLVNYYGGPTVENPVLGGKYSWQDCLIPGNGAYTETSILVSYATGEIAAELNADPVDVLFSNTYTWGSERIPQF